MKIRLDNSGKTNDIRLVKKFAWLPTIAYSAMTYDKYLIWLQKYVQQQKYVNTLTHHGWIENKNYI